MTRPIRPSRLSPIDVSLFQVHADMAHEAADTSANMDLKLSAGYALGVRDAMLWLGGANPSRNLVRILNLEI